MVIKKKSIAEDILHH